MVAKKAGGKKSAPKKASPATQKKLRAAQEKTQKTAKLGSGARFKALEKSVAAGGAKDPAAVAASIGRKKLGAKKMAKLAAKGRKK
jgi:hypothetical protein